MVAGSACPGRRPRGVSRGVRVAVPGPDAAQALAAPRHGRHDAPGDLGATILDPVTKLRWVDAADLPREASDTLRAIQAGPPTPTPRTARSSTTPRASFRASRGYYREFTVTTPGSADRGARRIVTGGPGEYFWTGDHYGSFQRIRT